MDDDRPFATGCLWAIVLAAFMWGVMVFIYLACQS